MTDIQKKGGIFIGKSHAEGGIDVVVPETGQRLEVEGNEPLIPKEALRDETIRTYTGTNFDILNQINTSIGAKSITQKATSVHAGDVIICKKTLQDKTIKTLKGTNKQIVSAINENAGCNVIEPGAVMQKENGEVLQFEEGGEINTTTDVKTELINRIPFLKDYNIFNHPRDKKRLEAQRVVYNKNVKVMMGDDILNFQQYNVSSEIIYYPHTVGENTFYNFIIKNAFHTMQPKELDDLTFRVFLMAKKQLEEKLSYNKQIMFKTGDGIPKDELDKIINEMNGILFEIEQFTEKHAINLFKNGGNIPEKMKLENGGTIPQNKEWSKEQCLDNILLQIAEIKEFEFHEYQEEDNSRVIFFTEELTPNEAHAINNIVKNMASACKKYLNNEILMGYKENYKSIAIQFKETKEQGGEIKESQDITLKDLESRLTIAKKMAAKNPELKSRIKIIEKMMEKMKEKMKDNSGNKPEVVRDNYYIRDFGGYRIVKFIEEINEKEVDGLTDLFFFKEDDYIGIGHIPTGLKIFVKQEDTDTLDNIKKELINRLKDIDKKEVIEQIKKLPLSPRYLLSTLTAEELIEKRIKTLYEEKNFKELYGLISNSQNKTSRKYLSDIIGENIVNYNRQQIDDLFKKFGYDIYAITKAEEIEKMRAKEEEKQKELDAKKDEYPYLNISNISPQQLARLDNVMQKKWRFENEGIMTLSEWIKKNKNNIIEVKEQVSYYDTKGNERSVPKKEYFITYKKPNDNYTYIKAIPKLAYDNWNNDWAKNTKLQQGGIIPSYGFRGMLTDLYKDHHEAWAYMDAISKEVNQENCTACAKKIIAKFNDELKHHFDEEEKDFFPYVKKQNNKLNNLIVDELITQHKWFLTKIKEMEQHPTPEAIKEFCNQLIEHIKLEEYLMNKYLQDPFKNNTTMENQPIADKQDKVTMNIPLLIRTLELAREDMETDAELHEMVERLLELKDKEVLTMEDYAFIEGVENRPEVKKYRYGGKISKEGYERKREWAARRMAENKKIDTLNSEQHEALEDLATIRHEIHSNKKKCDN